jgi:NAD+ kinase
VSRVGFVVRPGRDKPVALFEGLVGWLVQNGHQPVVCADDERRHEIVVVDRAEFADAVDLVVVLGGDGTMLYAAGLLERRDVPVLGVNRGRLGFLSPLDPEDAVDALDDALAGRLTTSTRVRLEVQFHPADGEPVVRTGLNDAVLHQGSMARMIELEARLDGALITDYRADGLIVATPTGSTAYNLAAGGPILMPGLDALSITPICAHALTNRPLVVPRASVVTIALREEARDGVFLTVDGQWAQPFGPGDHVDISTAGLPLRVYDSGKPYFDILREKLHWGVRNS